MLDKLKYILKLQFLLCIFFILFTVSLISFKFADPVETIIGFFNLDASTINGILVSNPDEIFIAGKFNFFIIIKLEKSPGVAKSIIFNFLA